MSKITICDICSSYVHVNTKVSYRKVSGRKFVFDGWSSTYWKDIDICDKCISKIANMKSEAEEVER